MFLYLSLCEPLDKDNGDDVATFATDLSGNFAGVVQYNKDNRAFEVGIMKFAKTATLMHRLIRNFNILRVGGQTPGI